MKLNEIISSARDQNWPLAIIEGEELHFLDPQGFELAARNGFFFVTNPQRRISLRAGDDFANSFYKPGSVKGFDYTKLTEDLVGRYQGYFRREEDQTEQFFLERRNWNKFYPATLVEQANEMKDWALVVLNSVLFKLGVEKNLLGVATGGAAIGDGTYTLTFNHFRPDVRKRGLNVHKDSGWVTLLRSTEPGLEVLVGNDWKPISPIDGTFIVNFGCAIEILSKNLPLPVNAASHRVVEQAQEKEKDRTSYALFVDSRLKPGDDGLFTFAESGDLEHYCSFDEFLGEILANTYKRDGEGLYEER